MAFQLPPRGVSTSGWIPFRIIKTKAKLVLNVRKVELYLGDLAQRMCPLMPSSKDFVHKVPHLFFDLVQCNGRRAKKCVESSQQKVVAPGKACPPSDALEGGARRMQVIA